ncbi:glycosyltransferase family 4 protein [Pseudosulfitobacter koreensis]|uniref:Glycosyltransferase family 4 protein n=1 Tax=Pseudosulfitobacter koreensis TaxID=2968472 RepID=A0ABT1Z0X8_9RHOB|nr:glycosyltransferase family 4 protein [Pseudosulfitobacter koreense]MCR8826778.1 glycosyltransferase family 4 protein [Pseudosulfitobacter koreense]
MKLLFVHQNMPGQYREFVQWLADTGDHDIVFLTQRKQPPQMTGVRAVIYKSHHKASKDAYGLVKTWENAAGSGFGCALAAQVLRDKEGWTPDIIIGHIGWGELTFIKEVYPKVPVIGFFEYYYSVTGGPVGFDPEDPANAHASFMMQAHNTVPLVNIDRVDLAQCPTEWQKNRFPKAFHDKMYVCHDGIRTDTLLPNPDVTVQVGRLNRPLTRDDEIVTYVARNLETTRGFHQFMRALPDILEGRPEARVMVVGGNDASYGGKSKHPKGLRGQMEAEVGDRVDWSRLHFLGQVPYDAYQSLIQISRCHIYLTMPFVLSWSLLESMSMQATIVASDVDPVREAITHGETGLLVDFFDPKALAAQVVDVLARPDAYAHLGPNARAHVVKTYDFLNVCLPEHLRQINALVPAYKAIALPA